MRFRIHEFRSSLCVAGWKILVRLSESCALWFSTMAAMQGPERSQLLGLGAMLNVCQSHLDTLGPTVKIKASCFCACGASEVFAK